MNFSGRAGRPSTTSLDGTLMPLAVLVVSTVLLRIPFWTRPLDTDEGLYAYGGWRMLEGLVVYRDLFDLKPPGVYFLNALAFSLTTPDAIAVYLAAALAGMATLLAIYAAARLIWGSTTALLAALVFTLCSPSVFIQGGGLNTEIFMLPFYTWALFFMLRLCESGTFRHAFVAGLLLGLAALFKQVGAVILPVAVACAWWGCRARGRNPREGLLAILVATMGAFIPWITAGGYFASKGALFDFAYWVVLFPFLYMGHFQGAITWGDIGRRLAWVGWGLLPLWLLAAAGAGALFRSRRGRKELTLLLFSAVSLVGVMSGGNFFPHYFIQLLPAATLLAAWGIIRAWRRIRSLTQAWPAYALIGVLACLAAVLTAQHYRVYSVYSGDEISAFENSTGFMGLANFGLSRAVGLDLRRVTDEKDEIYVWKDRPEISFYALRKTPSRLPIAALPSTPVMEIVLEDVKRDRPLYIVVFNALSLFRFQGLEEVLRKEYTRVLSIKGLPFAEQGIYRRKTEDGNHPREG